MENEPQPSRETFLAEYTHAQLAMRALDEQIGMLQIERSKWAQTCHSVVARAMISGIEL